MPSEKPSAKRKTKKQQPGKSSSSKSKGGSKKGGAKKGGKSAPREDLSLEEAMAMIAERDAQLEEKNEEIAKLKKPAKKPKLITAPHENLTMAEVRGLMGLEGEDDTELWNLYEFAVRGLWGKYSTSDGTWIKYKGAKADAVMEAIAKELPEFRRYDRLFPLQHIIKQFLGNQDSKLRTALLKIEALKNGTELPARRSGRRKKPRVPNRDAEDEDESEEADNESDQEEEEERARRRTGKPKRRRVPVSDDSDDDEAPPSPKPKPSKKRAPKRRQETESEPEDDGDYQQSESESGDDASESGDDAEGKGDESGEEELAEELVILDDDNEPELERESKPAKKKNAPTRCPACNDPLPTPLTPLLQTLFSALSNLAVESPAVPALNRVICNTLRDLPITPAEELVLKAVNDSVPLSVDFSTVTNRVFALRSRVRNVLSDPHRLAEDPIPRLLHPLLNNRLADFETAFSSNNTDHELHQATARLRNVAGYYGPRGHAIIYGSGHALVSEMKLEEPLAKSLETLIERNPGWIVENWNTPFTKRTILYNFLTPYLALQLIMQDLHPHDEENAFEVLFHEDSVAFGQSFHYVPNDTNASAIAQDSFSAVRKLIRAENAGPPAAPKAGKRKRDEDGKTLGPIEDEERPERAEKKRKTSGKENTSPVKRKLSLADFKPPPIKSPKKSKAKAPEREPLNHQYGTRGREKQKR
ncbi:RTC4 domain-containing protein [Mycena chlorophos]|uniref:RTC4 domain-containing protein n=1 Tax=Mycena chlorophos TaxID=658473 RepID=A0A8H6TT16_MYCCL|nr:RTC4 domain-containing protein [Mycena chlorophos]